MTILEKGDNYYIFRKASYFPAGAQYNRSFLSNLCLCPGNQAGACFREKLGQIWTHDRSPLQMGQ